MMLNLQAIKEAVDHFSPEELRELRDYLEKRSLHSLTSHPLSSDERIRRLDEAAKSICEGFSEAEWEALLQDMNEAQ
jgi:hypothetical protein